MGDLDESHAKAIVKPRLTVQAERLTPASQGPCQRQQFASALTDIAAAAALLTVLAFGAGWATGWTSGTWPTDRFTVGMVFVVRGIRRQVRAAVF